MTDASAPISIVVLGAGRIGKMHADLIATRVPGMELVGVFDVRPEVLGGYEPYGVQAFTSLDDALAADADAVCISTSTDTHVQVMKAAAAAGKHIFCEKPISLDLAQVDAGLAAVDAAGVKLQIGFNRRFDPSHRWVAEAVAGGDIGDVHLVRISSRDPEPPPIEYIKVSGGIFNDMTIHDFDMARYVTGGDVVEVFATGAVRVDPAIGDAGDVDTAVVTMWHENGAITTIDNSRQAVYGYDQRVEVFGSKAMIESANPAVNTARLTIPDGTLTTPVPYFFIERYAQSYIDQWAAFRDALTGEGPLLATGADGRAPLVIGMAAARSMAEHRPVRIDEID